MNVVIEEKGPLESLLTITLSKEDYQPAVNKELNKKSKEVQLKGFRKGKTPKRLIAKLYGQGIMVDVINRLLDEEMKKALTENDLNILGRPIPSETQHSYDFSPYDTEDYIFSFDIGQMPEIEIKGIDGPQSIRIYDPEISDEKVEEQLTAYQKQLGVQEDQEEDIKEKDILTLEAKEMEGEAIKKDGWETSFTIMVARLNEELRKDLLQKKKGEQFATDIFSMEKDVDEKFVRKHFLQMDEEEETQVNPQFQFTILEVKRLVPATLDQDFFDRKFGEGQVTSKEEAKEAIRKELKEFYDQQAEQIFFRDAQEKLIEWNDIPLPDTFLKRFLVAENENLSVEKVEKEYDEISKGYQWAILRNHLIKSLEVKVELEEVKEYFRAQIRNYLGGQATHEDFIEQLVNQMLQNEKQVSEAYETQMDQKLFRTLRENMTLEPESISVSAFEDVIQEINQKSKEEEE